MRRLKLGPLDAILVPGAASGEPATESQVPSERPLWVVLLHGFGAPSTDLVGLTQALGPLPGVVFVYPGGLRPLGGPLDFGGGRAWWPIDFDALDGARRRGDWDAVARAKPPGLEEARDALAEALLVLEREHGLERDRLILGGFSQGGMLACDFALRSPLPLLGLVLLSTMPIDLLEWTPLMQARRGLPVFQSHSPEDQVLPFALAQRLATLLSEAGLDHQFVEFRGGHGIPLVVMTRLRAFLLAGQALASG